MKQLNHISGRTCRRRQSPRLRHVIARNGFRHGGQIGQRRVSLCPSGSKCSDPSAIHMGPRSNGRRNDEIHITCNHIEQSRASTFVGHMRHFDVGIQSQHFTCQMCWRSDASRCIVEFARICFSVLNQFFQSFCRVFQINHHHISCRCNLGDVNKTFSVVVGQILFKIRQYGPQRGGIEQKGVTISRGFSHNFSSNNTRCTCFVVNHNGLPQTLRNFLRQDATQRIGGSARCISYDQTNGLVGITLGIGDCLKTNHQPRNQTPTDIFCLLHKIKIFFFRLTQSLYIYH